MPPVRMKASTAGSSQPLRITAVTCVGSSRTMAWPTTVCPARVSSSRIRAPLVSVSGVFESEIVRTKQPMDRGAFALCSWDASAGGTASRPAHSASSR